MDRRQEWFDRGCAAFKRAAPRLAEQIPWERFYVCPQCLRVFHEITLTDAVPPDERLTVEHVPPESAGGKEMVLTCGRCNWEAGAELDSHMRREADVRDFFLKRDLSNVKATLETTSGQAPIRVSVSERGIKMVGVPKAVKPEVHYSVMGDFMKAAIGDAWQDFTFKVHLPTYSPARAATSWLRSTYSHSSRRSDINSFSGRSSTLFVSESGIRTYSRHLTAE